MDPMMSGGKRRLVVTDGSQCLSGGYRWLRLCRWIEVVEVQAAAQTNFMADHFVHIALYRREFIQVDVKLVKRQMWWAHNLSNYSGRHVVILLVVQHVVKRYTLLERKKYKFQVYTCFWKQVINLLYVKNREKYMTKTDFTRTCKIRIFIF